MPDFTRYAIYFAPEPGPLAEFGAAWLGWDMARGCAVSHPAVPNPPGPIGEITETPRKYGFHGTIKPPFALAPGRSGTDLAKAAADLCAQLPPLTLPALELTRLGRFLALTLPGDTPDLSHLAARIVRDLDPFRAPPTAQDLARRRAKSLTDTQDKLLMKWGYPYVMEEFRFHITLTGRLTKSQAEDVKSALTPVLAPLISTPLILRDLCLVGEGQDGNSRLIQRLPLTGPTPV